MRMYPLFALCTVALVAGACDKEGIIDQGPPPPLAGFRYVNIVPDTIALNFLIVDIFSYAPNTVGASFRTGGSPMGIATTFLPPHLAVQAGTRRIKVFNSSSDPAIAQDELLDTTFTFQANKRYTMYLYGYSRTPTPALQALFTDDSAVPTLPAGRIGVRVLNLAPSLAGAFPTLPDTTVNSDAYVQGAGLVPDGTPDAGNVAFLGTSAYATLNTGRYSVALTGTGTTTAFARAHLPLGVVGTSSANPIAGSLVAGTALTAIVVPRSVVGSAAPQGGRPTARATQVVERSNDTVTIQIAADTFRMRRPDSIFVDTTIVVDTIPPDSGRADTTIVTDTLTNRPDTLVGKSGQTNMPAVNDVVSISGATEPEYNGWHDVTALTDSLACTPTNAGDTATRCGATNSIGVFHRRFRTRLAGTPASPATGTPVYRTYVLNFAGDYTVPYVIFIIDQRPPNTVP